MPDVAAVLSTYERVDLLKEAVASVQAQTLQDWELIIVDDASSDETWSWLQGLDDPRIRTFRMEENVGRCAARNFGLVQATADKVIILDDDDTMNDRAFERMVGALDSHPDVIGVIAASIAADERGHRRKITHPFLPRTMWIWPEVLGGWTPVLRGVIFRTRPVIEAWGFDETMLIAEDDDLFLRVGIKGKFHLIPWKVTVYRLHPGQWRPNLSHGERMAYRDRFVATLPTEHRKRAERIIEGKRLWLGAEIAYGKGEMSTALRGYIAACRREPWFLASPIHRPYIVKDIAKSLVSETTYLIFGRRLGQKVRERTKAILGAAFRRHPGQHRSMPRRRVNR
jgi:glycosyltransferase involved in cell wall biosynthesis